VGGREPGRLDELIRAIIERRAESLAAALRAEVEAATEQLREEARRRIDATKRKIADEIATTLKKELDHSFSLAEDWWDPYVGVRARYNLSKAFYLTAKADIGGFGVGSDLTWQASGALGCQVTRNLHTEIGYRYLYTDYDHDGFVYEVSQSGVEITAGITF
jgi:opacity protein-like surface antigen